jgi:hypothetical protein
MLICAIIQASLGEAAMLAKFAKLAASAAWRANYAWARSVVTGLVRQI